MQTGYESQEGFVWCLCSSALKQGPHRSQTSSPGKPTAIDTFLLRHPRPDMPCATSSIGRPVQACGETITGTSFHHRSRYCSQQPMMRAQLKPSRQHYSHKIWRLSSGNSHMQKLLYSTRLNPKRLSAFTVPPDQEASGFLNERVEHRLHVQPYWTRSRHRNIIDQDIATWNPPSRIKAGSSLPLSTLHLDICGGAPSG